MLVATAIPVMFGGRQHMLRPIPEHPGAWGRYDDQGVLRDILAVNTQSAWQICDPDQLGTFANRATLIRGRIEDGWVVPQMVPPTDITHVRVPPCDEETFEFLTRSLDEMYSCGIDRLLFETAWDRLVRRTNVQQHHRVTIGDLVRALRHTGWTPGGPIQSIRQITESIWYKV